MDMKPSHASDEVNNMSNSFDKPTSRKDFEELFVQENYTPEEAAELSGVSLNRIYQAAHAGRLPARIVGKDVVSIKRHDLIAWMTQR
jgi:excisionase family DNA binding protein